MPLDHALLCPLCQDVLAITVCRNPACPQDKPRAQQIVIAQLRAARQRQATYEAQWRANAPVPNQNPVVLTRSERQRYAELLRVGAEGETS